MSYPKPQGCPPQSEASALNPAAPSTTSKPANPPAPSAPKPANPAAPHAPKSSHTPNPGDAAGPKPPNPSPAGQPTSKASNPAAGAGGPAKGGNANAPQGGKGGNASGGGAKGGNPKGKAGGKASGAGAKGAAALPVNAKPFVPGSAGNTAAGPDPAGMARTGSALSNKAQPFVPQGSAGPEGKKGLSSTSANAQPFVPGGKGAGAASPKPMAPTALPFTPRSPGTGVQHGHPGRGRGRGASPQMMGEGPHRPDLAVGAALMEAVVSVAAAQGAVRPGGHGVWAGYWAGQAPSSGRGVAPPAPHYMGAPGFMSPLPNRGCLAQHTPVMGMQTGAQQVSGYPHMAPGQAVSAAGAWMDAFMHHTANRIALMEAQPSGEGQEEEAGIPTRMEEYHSILALEDPATANERDSAVFGEPSLMLKAISLRDGKGYTLRRVAKMPTSELLTTAAEAVRLWKAIPEHPALLPLLAAFASEELYGEAALLCVHSYIPGAQTLEEAHLTPTQTPSGVVSRRDVTEGELWSYLVQLASAIRVVHSAGMAFHGVLTPSKILLTHDGRVRCGSLGVMEALHGAEAANREGWAALQLDDLAGVGHTLLTLACGPFQTVSLDACSAHFTPDLLNILHALMLANTGGGFADWRQLLTALGPELILHELDSHMAFNDRVAAQLARECENGRLFRLACRLSTVVERPEGDAQDATWSETGDRYLLKLFYDFVFRQVSAEGAPIIDWGHIVECFNKVDAGVPEKVMLLSRDEKNLLVVSYADIKRCLAVAFRELETRAAAAAAAAKQRAPYGHAPQYMY